MMFLVSLGVLFAVGIIYWLVVSSQARQEVTRKLYLLLPVISQAEAQFTIYTTLEVGYFNRYKLVQWKQQYQDIYDTTAPLHAEPSNLTAAEKALTHLFLQHFSQGETLREAFNRDFIPHELRSFEKFFSNIEGRSLDTQQRTAIIQDEDRSLVIAGAGSGKTTTIVGKLAYLLDRYHTQPKRILLISFTNKSAEELQKRIPFEGIKARTFHKFGKDVICAVEGKQPSLSDEAELSHRLRNCLNDLMKDPVYARRVTDYFQVDLKQEKDPAEFHHYGEYLQYLKESNFRTFKQVRKEIKNTITFQNEQVKSFEEYHISNFLFLHGIEYKYEAPYEYETASSQYRQWKPDFTILHGGQRLYLEHLGINRDGDVPAFFNRPNDPPGTARARYHAKINFARTTSEHYGTFLLESYSYEMQEGTLFSNLTEKLRQHGIPVIPKSPEEIWQLLAKNAPSEVKSFHTLLQTFLVLFKSNNYTPEHVREKATQQGEPAQQQRNQRFLDILLPLHARYEQELLKRKELDFGDLINAAASYIQSGDYQEQFDYILIDEFQDLSIGRYRLLQAILEQNPHCKLFGVGDDWQSIYRFAGSDIALFKEFETYFGQCINAKIETTYRFHEPLISLSSKFITQNPNQTPKTLRSIAPTKKTTYQIVYREGEDYTQTLKQLLDRLIAEDVSLGQKSLLLMGRYGFDQNRIQTAKSDFTYESAAASFIYNFQDFEGINQKITLPFLTVHRAKGLEADIVILLNCDAGKHGFPSGMADDAVLSLVLSNADQFENGEERRLFYVALTRAKEQVFLLADKTYKSKFITELEVDIPNSDQKKCPECTTGDAILQTGITKGKSWGFYRCSNQPLCKYHEWS